VSAWAVLLVIKQAPLPVCDALSRHGIYLQSRRSIHWEGRVCLSGLAILVAIDGVVAVSRSSLFVQFYKSVPFAEEESAVAYQ
jgi:hypothetical protein